LYDRLKQGEEEERRPTYEDIYTVLVETSKSFAQTFVICDALDECDRHELREILLPLFHHMGKSGLRLFLTSRRYADDIEKGANVSATTTDCNKWTPLHMTTRYGQEAVALLLIQKGTDVSAIPPTATSGHHCIWPRSMGKW
jgi:hypothetical protein